MTKLFKVRGKPAMLKRALKAANFFFKDVASLELVTMKRSQNVFSVTLAPDESLMLFNEIETFLQGMASVTSFEFHGEKRG